MYFIKEHYRKIFDENVNFHKYAFNQRNENNAIEFFLKQLYEI